MHYTSWTIETEYNSRRCSWCNTVICLSFCHSFDKNRMTIVIVSFCDPSSKESVSFENSSRSIKYQHSLLAESISGDIAHRSNTMLDAWYNGCFSFVSVWNITMASRDEMHDSIRIDMLLGVCYLSLTINTRTRNLQVPLGCHVDKLLFTIDSGCVPVFIGLIVFAIFHAINLLFTCR